MTYLFRCSQIKRENIIKAIKIMNRKEIYHIVTYTEKNICVKIKQTIWTSINLHRRCTDLIEIQLMKGMIHKIYIPCIK